MRRPHLATAALLLPVVLAGCSSTGNPTAVAVTVTDGACQISRDTVPEGPLDFEVENTTGTRVDVFLVGRSEPGKYDKRVSSVDDVQPGETASFETEEAGRGTYEVVCQLRNGLKSRSTLVAEGEGLPEDAPAQEPTRSAEVSLQFPGGFTELDLQGLTTADVLEITVSNDTRLVQSFYIARPDGDKIAGVEGVPAGSTGTIRTGFRISGAYTLFTIGENNNVPSSVRPFFVGDR